MIENKNLNKNLINYNNTRIVPTSPEDVKILADLISEKCFKYRHLDAWTVGDSFAPRYSSSPRQD